MRYILSSFLVLLLAACTLVKNPTPVGRGYASYEEPYKSAPGPKPDSMGYQYSEEVNAEILGVWNATASDLVDKLEATGALKGQPLHIEPRAEGHGFYSTFDHVLREELRSRGYQLTPDGMRLTYLAAHPPGQFAKEAGAKGSIGSDPSEKPAYKDVVLTLTLGPEETPVAQVSETYFVPEGDFSYIFEAYDTSTPPVYEQMNP